MTFEEWFEKHAQVLLGNRLLATNKQLKAEGRPLYEDAQPQWQPPKTAPKDGDLFLADIGHPWPVLCSWSGACEKWAYAGFNMNMYEGEYNDPYFDTEWEKVDGLKAWMPMPPPPNNIKLIDEGQNDF